MEIKNILSYLYVNTADVSLLQRKHLVIVTVTFKKILCRYITKVVILLVDIDIMCNQLEKLEAAKAA